MQCQAFSLFACPNASSPCWCYRQQVLVWYNNSGIGRLADTNLDESAFFSTFCLHKCVSIHKHQKTKIKITRIKSGAKNDTGNQLRT